MKLSGIALGVIAAAGAAGVGGAWFTGDRIESDMQARLTQVREAIALQQMPGVEVSIELDSMQRGLFATDARYSLQVKDTESDETFSVLVDDHIEHGPFPASRLGQGQLAPVMAINNFSLVRTEQVEEWFKAAGEKSPLHGSALTRYDNSFEGSLIAEPLQLTGDDNQLLKTTAMNLQVRGTAEAQDITASGSLPSVSLEGDSAEGRFAVQMQGLSLSSDVSRGASGFYVGRNAMDIQSLTAGLAGQPSVELRDLAYKDHSEEKGGFLDVKINQNLGSVLVNGQKLGSIEFAVSGGHFEAASLRSLGEQVQQLQKQILAGESTDGSAEQVKSSVEGLLQGKPQLGIDRLALRTDSGEGVFSLAVNLDHPGDLTSMAPDELVTRLIKRLELRLDVDKGLIRDLVKLQGLAAQADAAEVEQSADMMAEMAAGMAQEMKIATLEGERLSTRLDYADGAVDFNGEQMPLMQFVAMVQGTAMQAMGGGEEMDPEMDMDMEMAPDMDMEMQE